MAGHVAIVGSFNVDHVWTCDALPLPGQTLSGAYRSGPGGKGFNQAVAAARAGAHVQFLCALGDDVGGQIARALAVADDIDLRDRRSDAPTGTAGIFVDARGANSIVIGPGANATLDAAFVEENGEALMGAAVVLAQLETPVDAVLRALTIARDAGVRTILNPAPANVEAPRALLELADVLTPNETEFGALLATHLGEQVAAEAVSSLDDTSLHALCRRLHPAGSVVVTLGAAGCFVSHPDAIRLGDATVHYRLAAEPVKPVDTTGAGDAFNGALAASLANEPASPLGHHLRFAGRYAALSTEFAGAALAMPTLGAVQARFG